MPFNYLACSIKGTAFSEYSSLLLITREMNSLSGGASVPNATPSPNTPSATNHRRSPSRQEGGCRRAHCGCGRHVNRPRKSGESSTSSPGSRPALAPSRAAGAGGRAGRAPPLRPRAEPASARAPAPAQPCKKRLTGDHHRRFWRTSSPSQDLEPNPSSLNFLLWPHFRSHSQGPRWGGGGRGVWRKEKRSFQAPWWRLHCAGGVGGWGGRGQFQGWPTFVKGGGREGVDWRGPL